MTASVEHVHPSYTEMMERWRTCRDTYAGEWAIKDRQQGQYYLPPTEGQRQDGLEYGGYGYHAYQAYLQRAVFHDTMSDAVEIAIGLLWQKDPKYTLTPRLEYMLTRATTEGEGLKELHLKLNVEQLVTGRQGLLLDLPATPTRELQPYIAHYRAESIRNWDAGRKHDSAMDVLNLVILDETCYERQEDFSWELKRQFRVLTLGSPEANELTGVYKWGVFREDDDSLQFDENRMQEIFINNRPVTQIPFVFLNSKDLVPAIDDPPMMGVANTALAIYRGEADYRQALYMTGQDTLVTIGVQDTKKGPIRIGAGSHINIPNPQGDAKFIGVSSKGLAEQRTALENLMMVAAQKAGQIIDTRSKQRESGEALKTRLAAQTATLTQIAMAGARALEEILKIAATWVGDNPEEIKVEPNLDFTTGGLDPEEIKLMIQTKLLGGPLTFQDIHRYLVDKGFTKLTFDELMEEIKKDRAILDKLVYQFPVNEEPTPAKAPAPKSSSDS